MDDVLTEPWFYWSIIIAAALPLILVGLTEVQHKLERRGSSAARPVWLLRTYVVPLGALLLILVKTTDVSAEATGIRVVTTVLAVIVLVMVLSGLSGRLFADAPSGSWRSRMPAIFLDVARFVIIAVGVALILAYVWGANVGGLFTALGISSIVLGLVLQNSVGQIISGLLLLFEQPFRLGDWVQTPSATGRVVEVNWRATHIDTGSGLEIIPNSVLAGQAFANLSRPAGGHAITITTTFGPTDSPDKVCALLTDTAAELPHLHPDGRPVATATSSTEYAISIPVRSPADDAPARSTFRRWLWYASRRERLHLDEVDDDFSTPERRLKALRAVAPVLRSSISELEALLPRVRVIRYGDGETMQKSGEIPARMSFVVGGRIRLVVSGDDGAILPVSILHQGDFLGQTALTREPVLGSAHAVGEVTMLEIERDTLERLVFRKPELLQDLSSAIDERRARIRAVAAGTADEDAPELLAGGVDTESDTA
jgi:small-conductance mechanosensitive channel/CRP-like cAMP-binding protein